MKFSKEAATKLSANAPIASQEPKTILHEVNLNEK